ncbi:gamma-type small acid-soluble spore protein [Caenibacillus caldisaponilyticus]|jgi:small acid-soluble spore protein E (minor gamma-type SASP)|uniref:gamma-type small acid-soluble spore protein n=1 Tax=Caenibacillus caldisaponilyticus TaxID=1674942 RepID=UPI0009886E06|nr:gamma-type small acid-soluble spore protein [Caenibacillus caldisaponilyticus]
MAKQKGMQNAGTNAQEVRAQNSASAAGQNQAGGQFKTEFASETNAQEVRQKNQKSQQQKGQNQQ